MEKDTKGDTHILPIYIYMSYMYMCKQNDSALKEEVWPFVTTWMTLEDIMLSGVCTISQEESKTKVELIEPEKRMGRCWPKGTHFIASPGDLTYSVLTIFTRLCCVPERR